MSQLPSEDPLSVSLRFLFHSAVSGLQSYITWTPEGLSVGKDRRLWVRKWCTWYHAGLWDIDASHTVMSFAKPGLCIAVV